MSNSEPTQYNGMGPNPEMPHILAKLNSLNSNEGTSYYQAVVIKVHPDLKDRIRKTQSLVQSSPLGYRFHALDVLAYAIAGPDYIDREELEATEDELEQIDDLIDSLDDPRMATPEELALLSKAVGLNCEGETLNVYRVGSPIFQCYEDNGYEYFEATGLEILEPKP